MTNVEEMVTSDLEFFDLGFVRNRFFKTEN